MYLVFKGDRIAGIFGIRYPVDGQVERGVGRGGSGGKGGGGEGRTAYCL